MILYLRFGGITMFLLGKSDEGLNISYNFNKIVIEGLTNARWISDCFVINSDSSGKSMVRIIC